MDYKKVKAKQDYYKKLSDDIHQRYLDIIKDDHNFQKPKEPSKRSIAMKKYWHKRHKIERIRGRKFVQGPKIWGFWKW